MRLRSGHDTGCRLMAISNPPLAVYGVLYGLEDAKRRVLGLCSVSPPLRLITSDQQDADLRDGCLDCLLLVRMGSPVQ